MAAVVLAAAGGAAYAVFHDKGADPLPAEEIRACNGSESLCDRRLGEVAFAGTHNSMSAVDRPGWYFTNQTHPIPRQLDDGIRLLMIDPHYGVKDADGRVRTDLEAEGTNRNRIVKRLGLPVIRAAERLVGRLGLLPTGSKRGLYLCHSLCELGAEPFGNTLDDIHGWLERHRSEVVIMMLESSVDPELVQEAFEKADLGPYLATLPRGRPLPTLREMIRSGRRLVALSEGDGGTASWFRPAYLFMQTTSISAFQKRRTSCEAGAGEPTNPMLVLNHWVDGFPPPRDRVAAVNSRALLDARIEACRKRLGRAPNLFGVDFYERGDLLEVVGALNRTGVLVRRN